MLHDPSHHEPPRAAEEITVPAKDKDISRTRHTSAVKGDGSVDETDGTSVGRRSILLRSWASGAGGGAAAACASVQHRADLCRGNSGHGLPRIEHGHVGEQGTVSGRNGAGLDK
jgi:hypothetical protein